VTLRAEWITDDARFRAVAAAWDRLAERGRTPFLLHGWLSDWWAAFGDGLALRTCVVWRDGEVAAALPLAASGRRRLEAVANSHSPEFGTLAADHEALDALVHAVLAQDAELVLPTLAPTDPLLGALARVSRRTVVREPPLPVAAVRTDGSFADYLAAGRWRRKELGRQRRRMERAHDVDLSAIAPPSALAAELQAGLELEASGWKGAHGTAILSAPQTERFYRRIATTFAERGELRLSSLRLDGELAAWELGVLFAGRLHALKVGYDERLRPLAPGHLLALATIERCFELGIDSYEMGPGDEDYKRRFANVVHEATTLRSYPDRLTMALRIAYRRSVRPELRRIRQRMRGRG
jgi:CelD/BcsL family acetyltransferase involved in cellulose biosynthesis